MKKTLMFVLSLILVFSFANSAKAVGTQAGTSIVAGGDLGTANDADTFGDIVANYTSIAGNDTVYKTTPGSVSADVLTVYGDTLAALDPVSQAGQPGQYTNFEFDITNHANTLDSIVINAQNVGGSLWDSCAIYIDYAGNVDTLYYYGSPVSTGTISLAEDASSTFIIKVFVDAGATAGGNITFDVVTTTQNGVGGDAGGYLGFNNVSYAGVGDDTDSLTVNVNIVDVYFDVAWDSIAAPTGNGYAGLADDTVPGSKMQASVTYDNDGNDTAYNFEIVVYIPENTDFDTASADAHIGANAIIEYSDGGAWLSTPPINTIKIRYTFDQPLPEDDLDDSFGVADGAFPNDVDAGKVYYTVIIK